jgi:hypothetical protein
LLLGQLVDGIPSNIRPNQDILCVLRVGVPVGCIDEDGLLQLPELRPELVVVVSGGGDPVGLEEVDVR